MNRYRISALLTLAVAVDCVALILLAPSAHSAAVALRAPQDWIDRVGPDAAVATLTGALLWLAACWLALGLGAAALTCVPGRAGDRAGTLARLVLPRTLTRLLAGATGLGILLAPVAAGASTAAPTHAHTHPAAIATAPTIPSPVLPTNPPSAGLSAPVLPSQPVPSHVRTPPGQPEPHPAAARARMPSATGAGCTVTVRPGDSLWTIAARRLGPGAAQAQIAAQWPRWYALNRAVIGTDPGLIRPGQVLQPPLETSPPEE
ncbi:MAG: LysM peptidoglycan-binding domain-containing protein [Jatrophihabitantaceae bacterium]